jgi:hypothetical protein
MTISHWHFLQHIVCYLILYIQRKRNKEIMISDLRIYFFNSFMLVQLLQSSYLLPSIFLKNSWINEYILIYDYFFALICLNGLVINNICLVDVVPLLIFVRRFLSFPISCIADYRRFDKLELAVDESHPIHAAHFQTKPWKWYLNALFFTKKVMIWSFKQSWIINLSNLMSSDQNHD